jgi:hypothetical protein
MDIEDDVSMDEIPSRVSDVLKGGHVAMRVSVAVAKTGRKVVSAKGPEDEGKQLTH